MWFLEWNWEGAWEGKIRRDEDVGWCKDGFVVVLWVMMRVLVLF